MSMWFWFEIQKMLLDWEIMMNIQAETKFNVKCDFCDRNYSESDYESALNKITEHLKYCSHNPANKCCQTCGRTSFYADAPPNLRQKPDFMIASCNVKDAFGIEPYHQNSGDPKGYLRIIPKIKCPKWKKVG